MRRSRRLDALAGLFRPALRRARLPEQRHRPLLARALQPKESRDVIGWHYGEPSLTCRLVTLLMAALARTTPGQMVPEAAFKLVAAAFARAVAG